MPKNYGKCKDGKNHKWCNHPEHRHCIKCDIFKEWED